MLCKNMCIFHKAYEKARVVQVTLILVLLNFRMLVGIITKNSRYGISKSIL